MRIKTRFSRSILRLLATLISVLCSAAAFSDGVRVSQGYVRATPPGVSSAAVYLVLHNETSQKVVLVGVSSNRTDEVMVHQNQLQGDMMRMRHVSQLEVEAGDQFRFEAGGYHLMLTDLTQRLKAGEQLQLRLEFQKGSILNVSLPVLAIGEDVEKKNHHE